MNVKAEVWAENGELMVVVEFNSIKSAQGAVADAMARLTTEMDYSTLYWQRLSITCEILPK